MELLKKLYNPKTADIIQCMRDFPEQWVKDSVHDILQSGQLQVWVYLFDSYIYKPQEERLGVLGSMHLWVATRGLLKKLKREQARYTQNETLVQGLPKKAAIVEKQEQ